MTRLDMFNCTHETYERDVCVNCGAIHPDALTLRRSDYPELFKVFEDKAAAPFRLADVAHYKGRHRAEEDQ